MGREENICLHGPGVLLLLGMRMGVLGFPTLFLVDLKKKYTCQKGLLWAQTYHQNLATIISTGPLTQAAFQGKAPRITFGQMG